MGLQTLAIGVYLGSSTAARVGAAVLIGAALLSAGTAATVWRRRHTPPPA